MSGTIVVGCNHPQGLVLHVDDYIEVWQDVQNGSKRLVKIARPRENGTFKLNGPGHRQGLPPKRYPIIGLREREGYALTKVDADLFNEWYSQNKNTAIVKNHVVIVHEKDTAGAAREKQAIRSGMEPLNPARKMGSDGAFVHLDPRIPNRIMTRPKEEDESGFAA